MVLVSRRLDAVDFEYNPKGARYRG